LVLGVEFSSSVWWSRGRRAAKKGIEKAPGVACMRSAGDGPGGPWRIGAMGMPSVGAGAMTGDIEMNDRDAFAGWAGGDGMGVALLEPVCAFDEDEDEDYDSEFIDTDDEDEEYEDEDFDEFDDEMLEGSGSDEESEEEDDDL